MPKVNKTVLSFNAGELSPLMDARFDQDKYKFGCRTMENFYPLIYGGAKSRPGTKYIATQNSSAAKGRAVDFEHSVDDTYMLIFENQLIRFFKDGDRVMNTSVNIDAITLSTTDPVAVSTDGAHSLSTGDVVRFTSLGGTVELNYNGNDATEYTVTVVDTDDITLDGTDSSDFTAWTSGGSLASIYEVDTPYLTADLFDLDVKQSADVMFITHGSYEPRRLSRTADTSWTLVVTAFSDGPFRVENKTLANTISVAEIAAGGISAGASVTLTAFADTFLSSATAGHVPSGAVATSKSQTGALFKLVYASANDSIDDALGADGSTSELTVYKGVTWDFITHGTWVGTVKLEREYNNSGVWETLVTVSSASDFNSRASDTEEFADAQLRMTMSGFSSGSAEVQLSIRDSSHIGIVKITAVASTKSATATVMASLGDGTETAVAATHRWSEGAWSNYRGWPETVDISPEERLDFGGSASKPLTVWGSVIGDFTSMKAGTIDDDAIIFTLIGSGQQNTIKWMVPSASMMIGALGGEHLLGASNVDEALTPTNVKANLKTTFGSESKKAFLINQAILFLQRGGRQIRELSNLNTNDVAAYQADDLTVFAEHIASDGGSIVDMAFQRTPTPMLWCVRSDGQIALMVYERAQNVFSWCRFVTDGEYESVAIMYGGAASEDEVWVTVKRVVNGSTVRYVERFANQNFTVLDEVIAVDSAKVVSSTAAAQNINLASDTVEYGAGVYGSSYYGGRFAG